MSGVSNGYRQYGVDGFYELSKDSYENPHSLYVEDCLRQWDFKTTDKILDVGCGNGLVTKLLQRVGLTKFHGIDKHMADRYRQETGKSCLEAGFENLWLHCGELDEDYDYAIFSYCYDLIPRGLRQSVLYFIGSKVKNIIIIRPTSKVIEHERMWVIKNIKSGKSKMVVYAHDFHSIIAEDC